MVVFRVCRKKPRGSNNRFNITMQSYITDIEKEDNVDNLKAIWWTIGMDTNIYGEEVLTLLEKIMERYNKIKIMWITNS